MDQRGLPPNGVTLILLGEGPIKEGPGHASLILLGEGPIKEGPWSHLLGRETQSEWDYSPSRGTEPPSSSSRHLQGLGLGLTVRYSAVGVGCRYPSATRQERSSGPALHAISLSHV